MTDSARVPLDKDAFGCCTDATPHSGACTHYNPMQFCTTLSCTPNTLCKSHKKSRCANHTAVVVEQMCKSEEKNSFLLALALSLLHCSVIPSSHTPAQSSPLQHLNTAPPNLLHKYTDTQIHKYTNTQLQKYKCTMQLHDWSHPVTHRRNHCRFTIKPLPQLNKYIKIQLNKYINTQLYIPTHKLGRIMHAPNGQKHLINTVY